MEIGIVGLGKMGANMARRMIGGGHRVVVANRSPGPIKELEGEGAVPAWSYAELAQELRSPRAVWMLSLIHISEPTRRTPISYAVFCLKKKKKNKRNKQKNQ